MTDAQAKREGVAEAVADRFVLQRQLGIGRTGKVYQAYDTARDATIAVKFLSALDPASLFRFKSEFRTLANLSHPNLLQLYELVSYRDIWLLTMELVKGTDFLAFVRPAGGDAEPGASSDHGAGSHATSSTVLPSAAALDEPLAPQPVSTGPYDEGRLRGAMLQLCEGLAALHRGDRLHRDLKPANVLVSHADARLVICDFGLVLEGARDGQVGSDDDALGGSRFEANHAELVGTLAYMSPEQARGLALTPASDWYSVGVMLYQALTGRTPFAASLSFRAMLCAKLANSVIDPAELFPDVPRELSRLALALLEPNPEYRAGYAEAVAALEGGTRHEPRRARERGVFVGREGQLAELSAAFERSRRAATVALVSGSSGMGKSALLAAFGAQLERDRGALLLRARCYEREELPYKAVDPLVDALSSALLAMSDSELEGLLPPSVSLLGALFPALRRVPRIAGLGSGPAVSDLRERRRLAFRALRELLRRLAQRRPLVLFIDDLQWGDSDSRPLLQDLLSPPDAPALLLVCAYRSDAEGETPLLEVLRELPAREELAVRVVDVAVGALPFAEATRLALTLVEDRTSAELIAREAEGSPFFIGELAAYALEHGDAAAGKIRLDALLQQQLASLSPDSRALLSALALAGRPTALATLRAALQFGPATYRALRDLEARRLVVTTRAGLDERVDCAHDRIREAASEALAPAHTEFLHRRLAEALEAESNRDCDVLRTHWRVAGERDKARDYAHLSAERAERALAFARAAELYREALELAPPGDALARSLRERLGHALILAGRGAEAAREFSALVPQASRAEALVYRTLATTQLLRAGKLVEGFAELARADDLFGLRLPRQGWWALVQLLARKLRIRFSALEPRALEAAWEQRASASQSARLDALWEVAAALSSADFLRGNVYGAELLLRALRLGDPRHVAAALGLEAVNAAAANRSAQAERLVALSARAAARADDTHVRARVHGMHAICRQLQGRWLESIALAESSQQLYRQSARVAWDHAIMVWWEMTSAAYAGQLRKLVATVPEALRDAEQRGDVYMATAFRTHRSCWAWLALDQPELADANVAVAEREWTPSGYQFQRWHMSYAYAEVDLYRGTPARSLERLAREWGRARLVRRVRGVSADMLYTRARLLLAQLAREAQPQLRKRAIADGRALRRNGIPYAHAFGTLVLASAARAEDREAARRLWSEAEGEFERLQMPLHVETARARRGALCPGAEGQALVTAALERIAALGVARPEAFVRLLAPA